MKLQRVGDYLLGEKLGEGSFAKVRVGLHVISREKVSKTVRVESWPKARFFEIRTIFVQTFRIFVQNITILYNFVFEKLIFGMKMVISIKN